MIEPNTNSNISYLTQFDDGLNGRGSPPPDPIASGATLDETQAAIGDSANEGIVLSLSGAPQGSSVYDAASLLNTFVQAGTATSDAGGGEPGNSLNGSGLAGGAQSEDAMLLGSPATGGLPAKSPAVDQQSLWVSALQANPSMSATVSSDALDQGLVSTLSVTA